MNRKEYQKEWNLKHPDYKREYNKNYSRSIKGKANIIWGNMKHRVSNDPYYTDIKLLLTKDEFISWVIPELQKWVLEKDITEASIDRVDPKGHYAVGNLQLLTMDENRAKARHHKNFHAPEGCAWCNQCKQHLTISSFYKDKSRMNGLTSKCKKHWK